MNEATKKMLFEKNSRIIEAVKLRAERICPGALDLIAVTGSFASGDYHEKSDLDLLIVIGDDSGYQLSHCFLLGDVGYDLYCHTWERLEGAVDYDSPYVSKLLDAQIEYWRDESLITRFHILSERLESRLTASVSAEDCRNAKVQLANAKALYFDALTAGENGYPFALMGILNATENAVYLLNHAVVRHGVRGICGELAEMPSLPRDYIRLHAQLFEVGSFELHITAAAALIRNTEQWINDAAENLQNRQKPCRDNLCGAYEELISNYRNKLGLAAARNDRYLSKMTLASAQLFFDEVAEHVDIGERIVFDAEDYRTPAAAENAFLSAVDRYERLYQKVGMKVCRYADIASFEHAYILGNM